MSSHYRNSQIYYGDGTCYIDGNDILGVALSYAGNGVVETMFTNERLILQGVRRITVVSLDGSPLTNLFSYSGTLKIQSAEVSTLEGLVNTTLNRIDNYSELINSNAEDITTISEKLTTKGTSGIGAAPKTITYPVFENAKTENHDGKLYLENGQLYSGNFHIHTKDGSAMTGSRHTPKSQLLYTKLYIDGNFKDRFVPTTAAEAHKVLKAEKGKRRSSSSIKRFKNSLKHKKGNS